MLGLSIPVPSTIRTSPAKKVGCTGRARTKWPSAITIPPKSTERRAPRKLSAMNPPGIESR
jgi:hypothetical protein